MVRWQVTFNEEEAEKLTRWAAKELRDPRDQIRFIVREALEDEKLLPADSAKQEEKGGDGGTNP